MKKTMLWRGLTALFAFLNVAILILSSLALTYEGTINTALNISTSMIVSSGEGETVNTEYYPSEFGEKNESNLARLKEALIQQNVREMEEGAVLLKNDNKALPLSASEITNVSLFGRATVDPVYRGNSAGSGGGELSWLDALTEAGFIYNQTLVDLYSNSTAVRQRGTAGTPYTILIGETPVSEYTDEVKASWVNDVAIVMIARTGGEDSELIMEMTDYSGRDAGKSQLALGEDEKDMMQLLQAEKSAGRISKIIVLINSGWAMEVGWLDDYDVDAALWIGQPGSYGFRGVANILKGEVNPSGKLADTYAENSLSSPAVINAGSSGTGEWTNISEYRTRFTDAVNNESYYVVQAEGIYIGYKYYETRYEDYILNQGNANSTKGSSDGTAWKWENEVTYPFGYGLSYTKFEQTLDSVQMGEDTATVTVTVRNTGDVAGKSVVQVYAQTPYGDYEKQNLVEKSAIQLVAYKKTDLIAPGGSQTITLEVDKYLLASYDYTLEKGYILSEGTYYLAIGDDSHDALNNILAKKGATGMVATGGASTNGNAAKVYEWEEAFDGDKYDYLDIIAEDATIANELSITKGSLVTNRFDDADINYWHEGLVTYLSRNDWDATWPVHVEIALNDAMLATLNGDFYELDENGRSIEAFTFGADNDLTFAMMKDIPYEDEVTWNQYLDQFTLAELAAQSTGLNNYQEAISVAKPGFIGGDGPDGGMSGTVVFADGTEGETVGITFCAEVVLASTFSPELQQRRGELIGEIGIWVGKPLSFAPGGNLHRTPFAGRNFEYMSEDPTLCYYGNYYMAIGMESKGVLSGIKHVTGNDQEFRREGLSTFVNEQTLRETSLRAEEGALRKGGAKCLMQSFNRLGVTFSSSSYALCTEVVINEWGFRGIQETDAMANGTYKQHFEEMLMAGTNTYCYDTSNLSGNGLVNAIIQNDDGEMVAQLRQSIKNVHYALSRSVLVNGLASNYTVVSITPWWVTAMNVAIGVITVLTVACAVMFVRAERKGIHKKGES